MIRGLEHIGIGFILDFKDKASRDIKAAQGNLKGLKRDAQLANEAFAKQAMQYEQSIARARRGMQQSLKGMAIGGAMLAPFALMVRSAIKAEDAWGDVATLMAAAGAPLDVIDRKLAHNERVVQDIGATTGHELAQIRTEWYKTSSALGEGTTEDVMLQIAMLSRAARGELESAATVMTSMIPNFGRMWVGLSDVEKADRIFNQVTKTVALFNTDLNKLAGPMARVAGMASTMNQPFEQILAVIGELQTRGLDEQAGFAIEAFFRELNNFKDKIQTLSKEQRKNVNIGNILGLGPEEGLTAEARKLAKIRLTDAEGYFLPVIDIIQEFEKALEISADEIDKLVEKHGEAFLKDADIFKELSLSAKESEILLKSLSSEGSRALLLLLGSGARLEELSTQIKDGNVGTAMFEARMRTTAAQSQILKQQISALSVQIGDELLPVVLEVVKELNEMAKSLRNFFDQHPDAAKWVAWGGTIMGVLVVVGSALRGLIFLTQFLTGRAGLGRLVASGGAIGGAAKSGGLLSLLRFPASLPALFGAAAGYTLYEGILKDILIGKARSGDFADAVEAQIYLQGLSQADQKAAGEGIGDEFAETVSDDIGEKAGTEFGKAARAEIEKIQKEARQSYKSADINWYEVSKSAVLRSSLGIKRRDMDFWEQALLGLGLSTFAMGAAIPPENFIPQTVSGLPQKLPGGLPFADNDMATSYSAMMNRVPASPLHFENGQISPGGSRFGGSVIQYNTVEIKTGNGASAEEIKDAFDKDMDKRAQMGVKGKF